MEELRVRRFADIQEEMCLRAVWRWESQGCEDGTRKKVGSIICIKVMVKRK